MSRPEHSGPAEYFYSEAEAKKYAQSSRMIEIQSHISARALELLSLPTTHPSLLLDVGCGTGLSGAVVQRMGHQWVGCDISRNMLDNAASRFERGCDVLENDMGHGLPFRPGVFDGAISISALQWLCYSNKRSHDPRRRLRQFFRTLYAGLARGGRAALQFYPENPAQMEMITHAAMSCGFTGGLVVDYPNSTKAKKYYLVLFSGSAPGGKMPTGLTGEAGGGGRRFSHGKGGGGSVGYERRRQGGGKGRRGGKSGRPSVKSKQWIQDKKDRRRRQGKKVKTDSKFTGRRRPKW